MKENFVSKQYHIKNTRKNCFESKQHNMALHQMKIGKHECGKLTEKLKKRQDLKNYLNDNILQSF